jgi:hypothetical protein
MSMNFWKYYSIGLAVLLGFVCFYSLGGGLTITEMITGRTPSRVITLLSDSNITVSEWLMIVGTRGYKTGFLYCELTRTHPGGYLAPKYRFEVDGILTNFVELSSVFPGYSRSWEIDLQGTKMWIYFEARVDYSVPEPNYPRWAVISLALYLRD